MIPKVVLQPPLAHAYSHTHTHTCNVMLTWHQNTEHIDSWTQGVVGLRCDTALRMTDFDQRAEAGGRLSYLAFEECIGAYILTWVEGAKSLPCAVSWCAVFSSSPVSEVCWLHHGIFSTRDFYIGLPSSHLVTFAKMLRKLVLGSVILWWAVLCGIIHDCWRWLPSWLLQGGDRCHWLHY